MYTQNRIVSVVTFAFFCWLYVTGRQFGGVGNIMPKFVGLLGMLCSVLLFISVSIKQLKKEKVDAAKAFPKKEAIQVACALVLVTAYCLLMKPVGFVVTSFVFFFAFALCFGERKHWPRYMLYSALVVAVIYFGFGVTLHTNFPRGVLI